MIERACCSVITVSGLDWISASPSSRLRARLSKRPCGLSAAPRPLMVTCDLSIAGGLNGLALLQRRDLGLAVAVGGEHGRGVLAQPRADPFDVPGGGRELGDDSGDLERRAVLEPRLPDHVARQILRVAGDIGDAIDLAVRHLD